MSRQVSGRGNGRGNGGNVARGAGFAAAKGAALIGVAVVIGIVLLNVVDDGSNGPASDTATGATTTTTAAPSTTKPSTATTADTVPAKTPAELAVLVLNGGAPGGAAASKSNDLKLKGYTNELPPADWSGKTQTGNVVMCKPGLDQEAAALATAVGQGTPVQAFPDPAPPGSGNADCVVVVGKSG
jgi:LytR cell envelope-related transcriptional attenuator